MGTGQQDKFRANRFRVRCTLQVCLVVLTLAFASSGCRRSSDSGRPGVLVVVAELKAAWTRNFNPLGAGMSRWPTQGGIYEPMMVYRARDGQWVPWLAKGFEWSNQGSTLTFKLRPGVKWSDGKPFSANDVVFTFELLKRHKALDAGAVWGFLDRVEAHDSNQVRFHFKKRYAPGFGAVAHQMIVPQHMWSSVEDPVKFTNPNPVATGPFH